MSNDRRFYVGHASKTTIRSADDSARLKASRRAKYQSGLSQRECFAVDQYNDNREIKTIAAEAGITRWGVYKRLRRAAAKGTDVRRHIPLQTNRWHSLSMFTV